jgi:hypothetical protein
MRIRARVVFDAWEGYLYYYFLLLSTFRTRVGCLCGIGQAANSILLRFDETRAVANQLFATFAIVLASAVGTSALGRSASLLAFIHTHGLLKFIMSFSCNLLPAIIATILRKPLCCELFENCHLHACVMNAKLASCS